MYKFRRMDKRMLGMSGLAICILLLTYHRFYDMAILVFPIAWAVSALRTEYHLFAKAVLGLSLLFIVPGIELLSEISENLLPAVNTSWWWESLVMPHQIWALCKMLLVVVVAMAVPCKDNGLRK